MASMASNPANIRVEIGHFLKCDLKDVMILVGAVVLAGILVAFNWKPAAIVLGIGVFVFGFSVVQARTVFMEGDVCPAVVIDPDGGYIAVYTDLSKGGRPSPALKILKQPLRRVAGGPFADGTRLAFVAMYNGFPKEPRWRNFGGYLANTGTSKHKVLQRVLNSITEAEWRRLDAALDQLEEPYRPGLHTDLKIPA